MALTTAPLGIHNIKLSVIEFRKAAMLSEQKEREANARKNLPTRAQRHVTSTASF